MKYRISTLLATSAAAAMLCAAGAAWADDAPAAPAAPTSWFDGVKFKAQLEVGTTLNPDNSPTGLNWGHAFTDQQNTVLLNGITLTAQRDIDTSSKSVDVGFKVQASYGSDTRYTQLVGEFNHTFDSINQFDLVEAFVSAHLPVVTPGGIDVKVGQYGTLEGTEVMDPSGNFFYSHSYIFNFSIPLKHTGIMTTTHVNPMLDLYLGVDSGVNTFLGSGGGANDNAVHFHGGFGLNFPGLTVLATTHIGPESFTSGFPNPYHPIGTNKNRYLSDVVISYTGIKNWTMSIEGNYTYDDFFKVSAGGVVGYLQYAITPELTIGGRAEVWRDSNNFFAAVYPGHYDFINFEGGYGPATAYFASGSGFTYGEFTLGLNYKPSHIPASLAGLVVRPEIRYDTAFSGGNPYDLKWNGSTFTGTKKDQFTFGLDVVIPFHL
jgi:hypothetical protein